MRPSNVNLNALERRLRTIFSIMSRWNDFLLPLVILNKPEVYTLQLALAGYSDENGIQYGMLLAMTTLTALPLALSLGRHFGLPVESLFHPEPGDQP